MAKKIAFLLMTMMLPVLAFAESPMTLFVKTADACNDLRCTDINMDAIDAQIVALIGERFAYAQRAGELGGGVYYPPGAVSTMLVDKFDKIGLEAATVGYSPIAARSIFSMILLQSNLVEERERQWIYAEKSFQ